jgi:hypothetical protein
MAGSLHVLLDDSSEAALRLIRGEMSDSEAIRAALVESAARLHRRSVIAAEVGRIAADDDDRAEMQAVREQMSELAPGPVD